MIIGFNLMKTQEKIEILNLKSGPNNIKFLHLGNKFNLA
jgi:hypothetical protein